MSKWLRWVPCLLLCCLLIGIPVSAAAAESIDGYIDGKYAYFQGVDPGYYSLRVYTDSTRESLLLDIPSFELHNGSYNESFDNLDSIFDNVSLIIIYNENVLQCALAGQSDHNGDAAFDLFGSYSYPDVVAELVPVTENGRVVAVSVFDVFAGIGSWIVGSLTSVSGIFWSAASGELTVLGVLAVSALAIAVVLGLIAILGNFLRFRS